jgi:undecaprenyl-diphosphatase
MHALFALIAALGAHVAAHAAAAGHTASHAASASHAAAGSPLTYWQAAVLGLLQGVTELFPVSSIGHTVIFPALFGWHNVVAAESANESFWLAFIVGLHVGTAFALLIYYRRDWVKIVGALFRSIGDRKIATPDARLAWLLVVATIPAGLTGLLLEHALRVLFTKPLPASIFLIANGAMLGFGEWYRRKHEAAPAPSPALVAAAGAAGTTSAGAGAGDEVPSARPTRARRSLDTFEYKEAGVIGVAQTLALIAGISRSGITMVVGLVRGLSYSDAARFSFLLATPIIFLAGIYKVPDLLGSNGNGVRGQALVGAVVAMVAAYISVAFLVRYFRSKNLLPFAIYCCVAGALLTIRFA